MIITIINSIYNFTYIQETGWFKCEERKIWMEMKKGNYSNINKINGPLYRKTKNYGLVLSLIF